jgi:hypothetical protein
MAQLEEKIKKTKKNTFLTKKEYNNIKKIKNEIQKLLSHLPHKNYKTKPFSKISH